MIIILKPSADQSKEPFPHPEVTLSIPGDDHDAARMANLMRAVMVAWGYSAEAVEKHLGEYEWEE